MSIVDQQIRQNDCGISAIKTVYNVYRTKIDRDYILSRVPLTQAGATLGDIRRFFDGEEIETKYHLFDVNDVSVLPSKLAEIVPCIIPIHVEGGLHYVVINSVKGEQLSILNPGNGEAESWSIAEFKKRVFYGNSEILTENYIAEVRLKVIGALAESGRTLPDSATDREVLDQFNKLTYYTYLKENFDFVDAEREEAFLTDLLNYQKLAPLPTRFAGLRIVQDKLLVHAPIALQVGQPVKQYEIKEPRSSWLNMLMRLLNLVGPKIRQKWIWFIVLFAVSTLLSYLTFFINQILIDDVLPQSSVGYLIGFVLVVAAFRLVQVIINTTSQVSMILLSNALDIRFITQFDRNISSYTIRFLQSFRTGDLLERVRDSLEIKTFILQSFSQVIVNVFVSIVSIVMLTILSWQTSLILLGSLALMTVVFVYASPHLKRLQNQSLAEKAMMTSRLIQKIESIETIRSFNLDNHISQLIGKAVDKYIQTATKSYYVEIYTSVSAFVITTLTLSFILFVSAREVVLDYGLTIGGLVTTLTLSVQIIESVQGLLGENLEWQRNQVILKRFFDFSDPNVPDGIREMPKFEHLECRNVTFGYDAESPILKDINLKIGINQKVLIQGENGSGKSTLAKILGILYYSDDGDFLINDIPSSEYRPESVRSHILYSSGDDALFDDSLRFNLTLGKLVDDNLLMEELKRVNLYEFVIGNAEGLDMHIEEGGTNLSTGQKRKVLILRALLSSATFIVFDEMFRGIDVDSRKKIETYLNTSEDRTFIFITHDETWIDFDTRLVLDNGELTQISTQSAA